jgi:SAM-dependent methyltransferase
MTYLATGFRDADRADEVAKLVDCLAFMDALPCFDRYKERSIEALCLTGTARAVDLCCGLGFDLRRMRRYVGTGELVGLDRSEALVARAQQEVGSEPGIRIVVGDARRTGLPDASFDAVRIDRSLQHIERPLEVAAEMARVLKPGGRAVVCEPDWASFHVTSGHEAFEQAASFWRNSFVNPRIGWQAADLLTRAGLEVFLVEVSSILLRSFAEADRVFDIEATLAKCVAGKIITEETATDILRDMAERSRSGSFVAVLTVFTVGALKR